MSTRYNDGSHYENHQRAKELEALPTHMHRVGEQHGKQEHLTAHEESRHEQDLAKAGAEHAAGSTNGHGISTFGHREIAELAHQLWMDRGCPEGSPEEDWNAAAEQLRARAYKR